MKRTLALLSALTMLGALTACGGEDSSDQATDATTEATTEAPEEEDTTAAEEEETDAPTEEETTEPPIPTPEVDANAISFEDGDLYTAHCLGTDADESACTLTVEEFNGSQQLRIQVLDFDDVGGNYKIPKIVFNIGDLIGYENLSKVQKITCDISAKAIGEFVGEDGVGYIVPGNLMGALGGALAAEKVLDDEGNVIQNTWSNLVEFSAAEWNFDWVYTHVEADILLDVNHFQDGFQDAKLMVMRWGIPNQADMYIDNLTFWDKDGNSIPLVYEATGAATGDAAEEATDAAAEEATDAAAE